MVGRRLDNRKIVMLALDFPPSIGGIQTLTYNICLSLKDTSLVIIAPYNPNSELFDIRQDFQIIRPKSSLFNSGRFGKLFYCLWCMGVLLRQKKRNNIKIVLCNHIWSGFPAFFIHRMLGIPYVVITHALEIMDENSRFLVTKILQNAAYVICYSEFTKQKILNLGVNEDKIEKLSLAVNLNNSVFPEEERNNLRNKLNIGSEKIILSVCRHQNYKGIDMVLEALSLVCQSLPNIKYITIGSGRQTYALIKKARRLNLEGKVLFLGQKNNQELAGYFDLCDVFILTSRKIVSKRRVLAEGFGIVFLEANSFGKPVIGGNSGGIPDAVIDGVTGLLVNPEDPKEIAQTIIRLLKDEALAKRLGENGKRRVEQEFNLEIMENKLKEIIDSI